MEVDIREDPDLWLAKGNIVIVCGPTAFRVHEDVLCRRSKVFQDLCSGAKAGGAEEMAHLNVTSCIVLNVVDTAYDIKQLLYALYDGLSFLKPTEAAPFSVLAALTRMAYKYQIDLLLAEATRRLRSVFTDSFEVWRHRQGSSTKLAIVEPHDSIEALNLLRLTGTTDMLPTAFYMCTRLDLGTLVRGVLRADASTPEVLSGIDLERCLSAQDNFKIREVYIAQKASLPCPTCSPFTRAQCDDRTSDMQEFLYDQYYFVARGDPLGTGLALQFDQLHADGVLCESCLRSMKKDVSRMQAALWEELPSLAGTVEATQAAPAGDTSDRSPVQATSTLSVTRDADIWFEEGNVVIVAGPNAFRVHTGQLSRHSPVFNGLFGIPQTPAQGISSSGFSDSLSLDGCPVVPVFDTAYDFKNLLYALYDGTRHLSPTDATPFSVLAATARMAHKYQVDWLLAEVTRRLKTAFPDRLTMWPKDMSTPSVIVGAGDAIEAFNLFRRIDRHDMLPAALYACCQLDLGVLVHGVQRADGAFVEKLDVDDLQRCLTARRELMTSNVKLALSLFVGPLSPTCPTKQDCRAYCCDSHSTDMVEYYAGADANILGPHFLEYIDIFLGDDPIFCDGCAQMFKDKEFAARLMAWRSLPGLAGVRVEGWGSVHAEAVTSGECRL